MPSIVVVALPSQDEPVWEYSSEKKPHLTLLYMEAPMDVDFQTIVEYVEHAAKTSLDAFGLSVSKRGTLGKDDADVLFFDPYWCKELRDFRAQLLKNDTISKHYVAAEQFPGWIPHLTMGYPEKPAKKTENPHELGWINFDRIAVFADNYDGPIFDLNNPNGIAIDEGSWSEDNGVYIMHYGVKGMRWGVRRPVGSDGLIKGSKSKSSGKSSGSKSSETKMDKVRKLKNNIQARSKARAEKKEAKAEKKEALKDPSSADHKRLVNNLSKDVANMSTADIKAVTARLNAVKEFKAATAKEREAKKTALRKLSEWALSQVVAGAKKQGENYIQEMTGDLLKDILPPTPTAKTKAKDKARKERREDEQDAQKKADREAKNTSSSNSSDSSSSDASTNTSSNTSSSSSDREDAINRLVDSLTETVADSDGAYNITTVKKKGG